MLDVIVFSGILYFLKIGLDDSAKETYDMAKKEYPESNPTLAFVPEEEELILSLWQAYFSLTSV